MNHESVVRMFERCAAEYADRSAIRHLDRSISYEDLEARANQLAHYLHASGAPRGALVAILAADPLTAITSIVGILKAGCAFVPLDTTTPEKRLAPMVTLTRPEWFIVEPEFVQLAVNVTSEYDANINLVCTAETDVPEVEDRRFKLLTGLANHENKSRPNVELGPDDLCYIYFTSGSTGAPKAIAGRLKGIDHFIRWEIKTLGVNEHTRVSQLLAHSFDGSLRDIFVPLCAGGTICVPPEREVLLDIRKLIDWIDSEQINIIHCVPSLFRAIVNEDLRPEMFASLQHVLMAGEALLPSDVKRWMDVFGQRVQLINLYGTSETTMAKFIYFVKPEDTERRFISIGKPMEGAAVLLVDAKGRPCPQGTIGEIYIRTPYRSLGYYNQPELTAKAFIRNPFSDDPNDIVYKTGDLGRAREDGNYEYLGRQDQQVKIRGVRVELEEIEDLLRAHESVKDIAVIDRQDGSDFTYLCAYVVFSNGTDPAELRDYASARLQEYMVPSAFIVMDELPRTISGKVDRRALPAVKETRRGKLERAQTPLEELLCGIWGEVLGLAEIGRQDNFFELGGHSLSATRVMSRVRAVTGHTLALRELFEAPTVALLAARLERVQAAAANGEEAEPPLKARANSTEAAPLSSSQQRLWFIDQLEPGSPAYNIPAAVRLRGDLNVTALQKSFTELVRRQEALRTSFPLHDGEPVQVIHPATDWPLPVIDLRGRPESEQELAELAAAEAEQGFDLAQGPLLRTKLVQMDEQEHVLLLVMHHIISDGWSLGVLVQELATHYESFAHGAQSRLPELELQYADYAIWQRAWLSEGKLTEQLQYWQESLAGAPPMLELPLDHPRGAVLAYRGGAVSIVLTPELSQNLKTLARRQGATLFMVLLAAFKTLLFRYTGQTDLVIGTPVAGRLRAELEPLIGLFVNTLALRTKLNAEESFRSLLTSVRETALGGYAHQELPFDTLVEHIQPDRSLSHHPLFQVMFVVQNTPSQPLAIPGLAMSLLPHRTVVAKFDLNLHLVEAQNGIGGQLYYNRDLFDPATAERLITHFAQLLESAVAEPDQPLTQLQMLGSEERQQMLTEWSRGRSEELNQQCIHRQFEVQVEKTPDATAVVCLDQQLTFRELNARANQLAHFLRRKRVGPETVVGIHMPASVESIVALLGILKAGGAYIGLDQTLPTERLSFILDDSRVALVLTKDEVNEALPVDRVEIVALDTTPLDKESTENPNVDVAWENLAYVIYTSGSTGRPKGVAGAHRQLAAYLNGILDRLHFEPGSSFTMHQALSIDAPVTQLLVTLCRGGVLHVIPQDLATDPDAVGKYFQTHRIDYFKVAPSHLAALQASERPEQVMPRRLILIGGEAAHTDWVSSVQPLAPTCAIVNHYGPTETTCGVMTYEYGSTEVHGATLPLGRPLPNTEIYVLDPSLNPVPAGVAGEIYIGGETLSRGYLNQPELTALKFIPNPFSDVPGARLYKTGDLARYLADGNVEFLARIDHQVKIRGFRVELGEIEAVLTEHPAVQGAAVTKWEQSPGSERLVAYIAANPATPELPGELAQYLRDKLPDYMIPSIFKLMDALPHTPQGKIDRRVLPAPDAWQAQLDDQYVAPRNATEEQLAEFCAQLLGLPRVGVFDNFFELGGHSLLATRLISRLRQKLQIELPLRAIFEEPTVAGLAGVIDRLTETGAAMAAGAPNVAAVSRQDRRAKLSELRKSMT